MPRKNDRGAIQASVIQPGDSGIWATCNKGREGKCVSELRDLFSEYAVELYGDVLQATKPSHADKEDVKEDIEGDIQAEIAGIKKPETAQLFVPVKLNVQCGMLHMAPAIWLLLTVRSHILQDHCTSGAGILRQANLRGCSQQSTAQANTLHDATVSDDAVRPSINGRPGEVSQASSRASLPHGAVAATNGKMLARRITSSSCNSSPIGCMLTPVQFAIRPTIRNHNILTRDSIIRQIATIVGSGHKVDLNNYDLLIIVEVYQVSGNMFLFFWLLPLLLVEY